MNWLLIVVVCVFAWNLVWGYQKGLLLAVYSLVSWIVVLAIVTWATPYVSAYIIDHTNIDEQIQGRTIEMLHGIVLQDEEETQETLDTIDSAGTFSDNDSSAKDDLAELGIQLPSAITEQLLDVDNLTDQFLENTGIYEEVARNISHMIINGAAFLGVLFITMILVKAIEKALDVISKISGISEINKFAGLLAGGGKGLLLIWLFFAGIAIAGTTEWGMNLTSLIYENKLLVWLYENNLVLSVILIFL